MPPCGTFDYVATVPPTAPIDGGLRIDATLREPIEHQGDELFDNRLLGYAPQLVIGWQQLVLIAAGRQGSQASKAAFEVDAGFVGLLRPEDRMHLVRTAGADLAVSVLRGDEVVVAFGSLASVPLGPQVSVVGTYDDVEISVASETRRIRVGNSARLGPYAASVLRCCEVGDPGRRECVAFGHASGDASNVAYRCALLMAGRLDRDPLDMTPWTKAPDQST